MAARETKIGGGGVGHDQDQTLAVRGPADKFA